MSYYYGGEGADDPASKKYVNDRIASSQMKIHAGVGVAVSVNTYDNYAGIGISTMGSKPGWVMTSNGHGGVEWKDPKELLAMGDEELRKEIPAIEAAYQSMIDAIKNYNMIVKLYRETPND